MLDIFLLKNSHTPLADEKSEILESIALHAKSNGLINFDCSMEEADAMIIQEKHSFKNFRYIRNLKNDPVFQKYAYKIFTINKDPCATGLIKGLYYSLPKRRYNPDLYAIVPYFSLYNELVLQHTPQIAPNFLACWRGNTKSNKIRETLVKLFYNDPDFDIQTTTSWYDHNIAEKELYKKSLLNAKFSLCPAGWAANSYRIYESMAVGKCPVIIADEYVPPSGPDWTTFSIVVPENKIKYLHQILTKREANYERLGEKAYQAWENFFSPQNVCGYYTTQLINLIEASAPSTVRDEFKRWGSFSMFYNNNWTIPQRALNKMNKKINLLVKKVRELKKPSVINPRFEASLRPDRG